MKNKMKFVDWWLIGGNAIAAIVDIAVIVAIVFTTVFFVVPRGYLLSFVKGHSMDNTLHDGQIVFADSKEIERQDIISIILPETENVKESHRGETIIKRVIGLPGDKVEITRDGIYVNGELLEEPYITDEKVMHANVFKDSLREFEIGEDEYVVLGDNRTVSYDSRFFGVIHGDDILLIQSTTPTKNFIMTTIFMMVIVALTIAITVFIDTLMQNLIYKMREQHRT